MKSTTLLVLCLACSLNSHGRPADANEIILRGKIINSRTHKPVSARVEIFRNSDFIAAQPGITAQGEFSTPLAELGIYFISISAPGYLETTDTLRVISEARRVINKQFYVQPIEAGLTVELSNIYFEFGRAELSTLSFPELDKTITFFRANPGVHFEIAGHTDRSGDANYNLKLSKDRAQAVVDYLTGHGVDPSQLIAQGYGESKPVHPELTREAEQKNRRVEFTVLKVAATEAARK